MDATLQKTGIRLYTGDYCPFCRRVRELERLGLDYEIVDADADMREEVIRLSGQRAIPILTIGDEVLVDSLAHNPRAPQPLRLRVGGELTPVPLSRTYSA